MADVAAPAGNPGIHVEPVGRERVPVIRLSAVTDDPQRLIGFARDAVAFAPVAGNLYPGVRAPMPLDFVERLVRRVDPLLRDIYGIASARLAHAECFFSIVSTPPPALVPLQMLPHIDTVDPLHFASVHYLCDEAFGGTAFYRQRATGFETISPEREALWQAHHDATVESLADRAAYPSPNSPGYEQVALFPARFDSMILYPSNALHAGDIRPDVEHRPDAARGRLTATMFLSYRPAG